LIGLIKAFLPLIIVIIIMTGVAWMILGAFVGGWGR
jgi:hypothetical protein